MRPSVTFSFLALIALLACGGPSGESSDQPAAPRQPEGTASDTATGTGTADAPQVDPQVASCLDLVARGRFQEALPACLAALKIAPDDPEVQAATQRARAESAKLADAEGAADQAKSEAVGQLGEASQELGGQPGQ
jgi:hypothetical protein